MFAPFRVFCFLFIIGFNCFVGFAQETREKTESKYLIFLHGRILEEIPVKPVSPEFGPYDFEGIVKAFSKAGLNVIAERRPKGTDAIAYADRVVRQIDSLKKLGVPSHDITVVGTSKGAVIAMFTSSSLKDPNINFVFIADCNDDILKYDINFCGRILSIYEVSDPFGNTCEKFRAKSTLTISHYKEIELNTGLKHGFIYSPRADWITPSIDWAKGQDSK